MVMASLLIADEIHELKKKIDSDLIKITSLEEKLESKDQKIENNQRENKEYLNSKNGELNDLFSKLVSLN